MATREEASLKKAEEMLSAINTRLASSKIRARIVSRNGLLSLRGNFPPKPKPGGSREDQQQRPLARQRIPLGIPLRPASLKEAELKAEQVWLDVRLKKFYWEDWSDLGHPSDLSGSAESVSATIAKYKKYWLRNRKPQRRHKGWSAAKRKAALGDYWGASYQPHFNKLAKYAEAKDVRRLELRHLTEVIATMTEPDTRSRVLMCQAFLNFSKWAGTGELDIAELKGTHSPLNPTAARKLPTNEEVIEFWESIDRSKETRDIFGVLAAYGLRNHEIYFIEPGCLAKGPELVLLDGGKTGSRIVYPHPPSWYERFNLKDATLPTLPNLHEKSNKYLGNLILKRLVRAGIAGSSVRMVYNLRHADAVRRIMDGVPDSMGAKGQGHSKAVHDLIYGKHMQRRDFRAEFERQATKEQG